MTKESHKRSITKGFSWRLLGTIDTTLISWFVTGNPLKALSIGGIEVFTKVILYYFHERIWQRIPWGKPVLSMAETPNKPSQGEFGIPKQFRDTTNNEQPTTNNEQSTTNNEQSTTNNENLHPIHHHLLSREEREAFLNQKSKVIWLTGLSGSGKSTIAIQLERRLFEAGHFTQVLDGDNIRTGINNNLGFSLEDRQENIRRIAEVAKLYCHSGIVTVCTFISPTREIRAFAKDLIGPEDFIEIYVSAPLEVCEQRDVKGLYQKARRGEIKNFTGIDSPYEPPEHPDLVLDTAADDLEFCVQTALDFLTPRLK